MNYLVYFAKNLDACKCVTEMMIWRGERMQDGDFSVLTLAYWPCSQPHSCHMSKMALTQGHFLVFYWFPFLKVGSSVRGMIPARTCYNLF